MRDINNRVCDKRFLWIPHPAALSRKSAIAASARVARRINKGASGVVRFPRCAGVDLLRRSETHRGKGAFELCGFDGGPHQ